MKNEEYTPVILSGAKDLQPQSAEHEMLHFVQHDRESEKVTFDTGVMLLEDVKRT